MKITENIMSLNNLTIITDRFGTPIKDASGATLVQKKDGEVEFVRLTPCDEPKINNAEYPEEIERNKNASNEFSDAATRLLLSKYLEKKDRSRNPKIKKAILWKEVTEEMNQHGYTFIELKKLLDKI